jgi:octaprenyl-diphosphate synthase
MIAALAGLAPHLAAVEREMAAALADPEPRVAALIADLGRFHGKMLRPALLLLVAESLGRVGPEHYRLGAALELIHTATLIHDDLIDDGTVRRGVPTAHVRLGNTTAVLLGDYFYTRAFALVADLGDIGRIKRITEVTGVICRGELHQQVVARDTSLSEAEYERIIYAKTACLTELAAEYGALDGDAGQRAAAAEFGRLCGMAFQIADDCLDLAGDALKVGKTLATDLERGRMTLPILRHLAAAPDRAAAERRLLGAVSAEAVESMRAEVVAGGALASALASAHRLAAQARAVLAPLPPGPGRERLAELAEFLVARDH